MSSPTVVAVKNNMNNFQDRIICCPYVPLFAVPVSCTVIGFLFFHIAAFGCKTFQIDVGTDSFRPTTVQLGYWSVYSTDIDGCLKYSNNEIGSIWKFGRFVGIVGSLLSWVVLTSVLLASCFKYPHPKVCFTVISVCMGIISFFSFLLLVGLAEAGSDLSVSAGSALAIVGAFMWAGGAASMFLCMKERAIVATRPTSRSAGPTYPVSPVTDDPEIDITEVNDESPNESMVVDTQVERIMDPNGNETVITTTTTFLPDGTKRVMKTIETTEDAD